MTMTFVSTDKHAYTHPSGNPPRWCGGGTLLQPPTFDKGVKTTTILWQQYEELRATKVTSCISMWNTLFCNWQNLSGWRRGIEW